MSQSQQPDFSSLAVSAGIQETLEHALAEAHPLGLVAAYLFGSHAAGRAHRESDVDIGILLDYALFPTRRERFEERVRVTSWVIAQLGINDVDVVVLNDAPPQFARRIVFEGRGICGAGLPGTHAFVRDVQLRAADLEPFLRRMRHLKREVLSRS